MSGTGGIFAKNRFRILNATQHPYKHTAADFPYTSDALSGVTNIKGALDQLIAVLYPQSKAAVANQAALPLVGNSINDFRVVSDDGDGKAAGYRWEQREGEISASWHKIYDLDWGTDSILQGFLTKTQDLYVKSSGNNDIDSTGTPIAGTYAGQTIFGGTSANTNLTLKANSGDGTGASTGYVQVDDHFRPSAATNTLDLGLTGSKWRNLWVGTKAYVGNITLEDGKMTSSSGAISFDNEDVSTTGDLSAKQITATDRFVAGTTTLDSALITDSTGSISFDNENLTTTGNITGGNLKSGTLTITDGSISDSDGSISFGSTNLSTTGTLGAGTTTVSQLNVDNLRLDGNILSAQNTDGNLVINANGTGVVDINSALETLGQTVVGTIGVTGSVTVDNLSLDGNVLSNTSSGTDLLIQTTGVADLEVNTNIKPSSDNAKSLGLAAKRFSDLFLGGNIKDGTNTISVATMISLRDINVAASAGMTLFYDGTKWNPSVPDTEVDHGTISGLSDDDHTQYALLAGRTTGQTLQGGTQASAALTLDSTSHGTKGLIRLKSNTVPDATAAYSGGWTGVDLGTASLAYRNIYMRGEGVGFRAENLGSDPSPSVQNVGRIFYNTDSKLLKIDTGTTVKQIGSKSYNVDTVWNGTDLTKTVTVSSGVDDARNCQWSLQDNTNDFERIYATIKAISATQVTITTTIALPAANYRLLGVEVS